MTKVDCKMSYMWSVERCHVDSVGFHGSVHLCPGKHSGYLPSPGEPWGDFYILLCSIFCYNTYN